MKIKPKRSFTIFTIIFIIIEIFLIYATIKSKNNVISNKCLQELNCLNNNSTCCLYATESLSLCKENIKTNFIIITVISFLMYIVAIVRFPLLFFEFTYNIHLEGPRIESEIELDSMQA